MVLGTIGVRATATAATLACLMAACSGDPADSTPAAVSTRATSLTEPPPRIPEDAHPDVAVWYTQDYVELWAVDTDAGVLIVTAEAANPDELAVALELHEQVRTTLELL
jgi:hypothetical protein